MNRSGLRLLIVGMGAVLLLAIGSWGWTGAHGALRLVFGGVQTFPQGAAFLPKQTPAMAALLTNPEKLNGLYQTALPLNKRSSSQREWQQWSQELLGKIGLDYRQLKPWLGDELTFALTARDFDHNARNGLQPGYLIIASVQDRSSAQNFLRNYYGSAENMVIEDYKGAQIVSPANHEHAGSWSGALVGQFVLLANHPQVVQEAIHQAQALSLNLQQSADYRRAIAQFSQPHAGFIYFNVVETLKWLDADSDLSGRHQVFSGLLSTNPGNLILRTALLGVEDAAASAAVYQALLQDSALAQLVPNLALESKTYIDLGDGASLLNQQAQPYQMSRLAMKALFPHLRAIAIDNQGVTKQVSQSQIRFQLDS